MLQIFNLICSDLRHLNKFEDLNYIYMIYDPEANIISIELGKAPISHAREFGNFIIHLSGANKPVLIEILDGSKFVGQFDKLKMPRDVRQAMPI